ncbi:MAG TPA: HPr family phosphocarrier protein [Spirochaetia bacterium]|nr:HPr family phosphocarrier protein [Spirochaetia bacterium]
MVTKKATIKNSAGIHLRPSGIIMKAIEQYEGRVRLGNGTTLLEADHIMSIIALGLCEGDFVTIQVEGPNETEIAEELVILFQTHFDFPPRD